MKKKQLKSLKLKRKVISNLAKEQITGGTQYVCPTFAADRFTCPGYQGNPTPCQYPKSYRHIRCQAPVE
ncbi:hypothetical protein [uncultured Kordia sp.]|uniref:hypothetical protein n=1 Tax=uncultured Kordia sp. TaxID=507699 RepID=UPI00261B1FF4|nr:hypothetical protein [uncultured Kordia sp.]